MKDAATKDNILFIWDLEINSEVRKKKRLVTDLSKNSEILRQKAFKSSYKVTIMISIFHVYRFFILL